MNKRIAVLEGDGVGAEIMKQAIAVLKSIEKVYGHQFEIDWITASFSITGNDLPDNIKLAADNAEAILSGPLMADSGISEPVFLNKLKEYLGFFITVYPVSYFHFSQRNNGNIHNHLSPGLNFLIFRETTEGFTTPDSNVTPLENDNRATDQYIYTAETIERVAHKAFMEACNRKNKLTVVTASGWFTQTGSLWFQTVQAIGRQYPNVTIANLNLEKALVELMLRPGNFDVILTDNFSGAVISAQAALLIGGGNFLTARAYGNSNKAVFKPAHGAQWELAGKDMVNPLGAILCVSEMLKHFGLINEAAMVVKAINWTLQLNFVTKDIDPVNFYFTSTIGDLICDYILQKSPDTIRNENIELRKSTII